MGRAACRPDPSWTPEQQYAHTSKFFPQRGESHAEAKKMCARCPVQKQCGDYADSNEDDSGIWGGRTRSRGNWKTQPEQTTQPEQEQEFVIPNRLSASSIQVYLDCPARWKAEYMQGAKMPSGSAASLGTTCHEVFEAYVKDGYHLTDSTDENKTGTIKALYDERYWANFSDGGRYEEGLEMCRNWVLRQNWVGRTVIDTENRVTFQIPTSAGLIDFMYVIDRLDQLDEGTIEIIDYKSFVQPVQPQDLKQKPQCRVYALGIQMRYPDAEAIWMTFDLLRYDTIGIVFTKEENRATWRWLCALAEKIVQDETAEEKLNDNCRYCVRKHECSKLAVHLEVGGPLGITDVNVAAKRFFEIDRAAKALEVAKAELEKVLLAHMESNDVIEDTVNDLNVSVTVSSRRDINPDRVRAVVGDEVMARYGTMTVGQLDKLMKSNDVDDDMKFQLKRLISMKYGDPKIKVNTPDLAVA
jgi:RecB family exonuclease